MCFNELKTVQIYHCHSLVFWASLNWFWSIWNILHASFHHFIELETTFYDKFRSQIENFEIGLKKKIQFEALLGENWVIQSLLMGCHQFKGRFGQSKSLLMESCQWQLMMDQIHLPKTIQWINIIWIGCNFSNQMCHFSSLKGNIFHHYVFSVDETSILKSDASISKSKQTENVDTL